jgi:hypothetical protein
MYFGLIGFGIIIGLVGALVGLVILILFLLNLMRLLEAVQPGNRAMTPGLVWLNLIPVFSLGWMIYTVIKIKESVRNENNSRQAPVDEGNTHSVGLVYAVLAAASFVFSYAGYASRGVAAFAGLLSLATLITWIIYWVKTNGLKRDLQMTVPGGYGPGGQPYGPGGPYAPGDPSYGPGYGPGVGVGYGGYGPSHGDPPAGSQPPVSQPPAATPPSGAEQAVERGTGAASGQNCSQCGNELDPTDQFCKACGQPTPKG